MEGETDQSQGLAEAFAAREEGGLRQGGRNAQVGCGCGHTAGLPR